MPRPSPVVDGYELDEALGSGGSGTVYRARRRSDGLVVALKVLEAGQAPAAEDRLRFAREGRLLAAHPHPALVPVLGLDPDGEPPWIATALMEGGSLAGRLEAGPLPAGELAEVGGRLAGALAHLHARGVLHRDVKPGNVLLDRAGKAFLGDLGLARGGGEARVTRTGYLLGTPGYLAPELVDGAEATEAADLYALGVTLVEAASGQRPEPGVVPAELPPGLPALVRACLRTDPGDRPGAAALAEAFSSPALGGARGPAPVGATASLVVAPAPRAGTASPRPVDPGPVAIALLAAILAGGLGWMSWGPVASRDPRRWRVVEGAAGDPFVRFEAGDVVRSSGARVALGGVTGAGGEGRESYLASPGGIGSPGAGETRLAAARVLPAGPVYLLSFTPRRFGSAAPAQRELALACLEPGPAQDPRWKRLFVDDGAQAPSWAELAADPAGVAAALVLPGPAGIEGVLLVADPAGHTARVPLPEPPVGLVLCARTVLVAGAGATTIHDRASGRELERVEGGPGPGARLQAVPGGVAAIGAAGELLRLAWDPLSVP